MIESYAQIKNTEHTLKLTNAKKQQKATIKDMSWLSGSWIGEGFGTKVEEVWNKPKANSMMCMFQMYDKDKVMIYEFCQIVEENKSLTLKLKHFDKNLNGWETKEETVDFKLIKIEGTTAYFDGLTYKREENILYAWVSIKNKDGSVEEGSLVFKLNLK
jgi:hypothetical protein